MYSGHLRSDFGGRVPIGLTREAHKLKQLLRAEGAEYTHADELPLGDLDFG